MDELIEFCISYGYNVCCLLTRSTCPTYCYLLPTSERYKVATFNVSLLPTPEPIYSMACVQLSTDISGHALAVLSAYHVEAPDRAR